ncbi:MAG: hypothetical protein QNI84_07470 [Henriciella sp.]|nr:hypothetical protein [Henriciella sp.]
MATTQFVLKCVTVFWVVLAGLGLTSFVFDLWSTIRVWFFDGSGTVLKLHSLVLGWAAFLGFPTLSILAARDLDAIPDEAQEYFRLQHLGWLGWLGLLLLVAGCFAFTETAVFHLRLYSDGTLSVLQLLSVFTSGALNSAVFVWLGAICLYARYRIAANKRLASDPGP